MTHRTSEDQVGRRSRFVGCRAGTPRRCRSDRAGRSSARRTLAGSEHDRSRVLLVADADSETDIHQRLADDPWVLTQRLVTTSVEPWNLFVGAERLGAQPAAHRSR